MGIRERILRWLGGDRFDHRLLELETYRMAVDEAAIYDRSARKALAEAIKSFSHLDARVAKLEGTPEPTKIEDPVSCPEQGHTGLIRLQIVERVSASDPTKTVVVGGGYYCPHCGVSFYTDGTSHWRPKGAQPEAPEPDASPSGPAPKSAAQRIRFQPPRRER